MPRVRRPAAPTSAATLLQLMWLASPALPVGGFSYSEGLESAVESGHILGKGPLGQEQSGEARAGEVRAAVWLLDQLHLSLARCDIAVAAQAFKAWRRNDLAHVTELNDWVRQTRESAELRQQTEQMGRSLVEWLRNGGSGSNQADARIAQLAALAPAPTWPVAFALAAAQTPATLREGLLAFAFGWCENMVQAAMKAVPLGQSAAQRILARLADAVPAAVAHAMSLADSQRQAHTPMLAILSAQHEVQYSRLFRS